ncbi:MAG: iron ABC transporter permease [Sedimentisphaerales bacterium]|nr:iron ABC transporter permease [Sedimentisphaerales bacterium]
MTGKIITARALLIKIVIALVILVAVMAVCSMIGDKRLSLGKIFAGPGAFPGENTDYEIFFGVRLPRVILAAIIGAALAGAGVVLQALLRNPLADPYILGISSGAGLGAMAAILLQIPLALWGGSPVAIFAFIGAIGTVWLVWMIGHFTTRSQVTSLLLAGVVVNAFLSAVIMFLTSIARSQELQATVFWLMGNITETDLRVLWVHAILVFAGLAVLFSLCAKLNVLSFGEEQAQNIGISPSRVRLIGFGVAAVITALAVSLSGLVGFVGLIVPHAVRLVFGPDHRQLLPLSAITGAIFLIVADTIARIVVAPAQLPVGVVTAIAGGPFFLILLARYTRKISF